jgi:hypothetical protein
MGILLGMSKTEANFEIKRLAVKALGNAISFMNKLLETNEVRIYLLDLLVSCALENDPEI